MDWRISNGAVVCSAPACGDHPVPAGEPYVRVRCGTNRCQRWVEPQRQSLDERLAETHQALEATPADDETTRRTLAARIADLTAQRRTLDPPTDLRTPVPVPAPTLPFDPQGPRRPDFVSARQLTRSVNYNRAMDAKRRTGGR